MWKQFSGYELSKLHPVTKIKGYPVTSVWIVFFDKLKTLKGLITVNRDPSSTFFIALNGFNLLKLTQWWKMSNQAKEREVNYAMATHLTVNVFAFQG